MTETEIETRTRTSETVAVRCAVTARRPSHYLLLKGERDVYEREPQPVWAPHDATCGSTEALSKFESTTIPTLTA